MYINYADFVGKLKSTAKDTSPIRLDILHAAVGISGEAGELLDIIKKWFFQGHQADCNLILEELGDIIFYVQFMCNNIGASLDEVIKINMKKLSARYPEGKFDINKSIDRSKYGEERNKS